MILYPIILFAIIGIAWGLIVLVHKANVAAGKEQGSDLGGLVTLIIVIGAILALCYFWDALGGGYDLSTPIRR